MPQAIPSVFSRRTAWLAVLIVLHLGGSSIALAQSPAATEVRPDGRVLFRLQAPSAAKVTVTGDFTEGSVDLVRDGNGLWTASVGPLRADIYGYTFMVDGVRTLDPRNPNTRKLRPSAESVVEVTGDQPALFTVQNVPHGTTHFHWYQSPVLNEPRSLIVYTPPSYESAGAIRFPVLYLLHGAGEDVGGWVANGPSSIIVDNLIAQGRARSMIIVMPLGHVGGDFRAAPEPERARRIALFEHELLETIVPFVEQHYRADPAPAQRAIAGLSMGGAQALRIGLDHADQFAWLGSFGAAIRADALAQDYPAFFQDPSADTRFKLLWLGCGRADRLYEANRAMHVTLTARGVHHVFHESEGGHTWVNWRAYFIEFVPLLFKP